MAEATKSLIQDVRSNPISIQDGRGNQISYTGCPRQPDRLYRVSEATRWPRQQNLLYSVSEATSSLHMVQRNQVAEVTKRLEWK